MHLTPQDLVGAAAVCVSMGLALGGGSGGALAGLAGAHSLLLPAYLAHLAKCRADLDQHLAAVERVQIDTNAPQEDYRDDCELGRKMRAMTREKEERKSW